VPLPSPCVAIAKLEGTCGGAASAPKSSIWPPSGHIFFIINPDVSVIDKLICAAGGGGDAEGGINHGSSQSAFGDGSRR
jgi:hypothetical protein